MLKTKLRGGTGALLVSLLLMGCSGGMMSPPASAPIAPTASAALPQPIRPSVLSTTESSVSNRCLNLSPHGVRRTAQACGSGGSGSTGYGGGYQMIDDLTYVDHVPDSSPLAIEMNYNGVYDVKAYQATPSSQITITLTNKVTGAITAETIAPQNTSTRHPLAGVSCGFWCGYLASKMIDFMISWVTDPCGGDCGQIIYAVPTSAPRSGTQWYPTPSLIPTGGQPPAGWGLAPADNGDPYTVPNPSNCRSGWVAANCTDNPHNTYAY